MAEPRTLLEALAAWAGSEPKRTVFHFEGAPVTYGRLWRSSGRFAARLLDRGLEPGGRVVIAIPNGPDFFTAFYGAQRAGGVPVPLYPGSGSGRLAAMAARCGARHLVLPAAGDWVESAAESPRSAVGLDVLSADEAEDGDAAPGLPEVASDDLAYLQYTSGSTGEPKGVEIRHRGLIENMRQMIAGMAITADDVFVSWLPVHHDMGLVLMTMVPFYLGAPLFLLPTSLRNPGLWLSEIARRRATFTAAPDFAYRVSVRRAGTGERYDLASLRVALNAAEPVRAGTLEAFEELFGLRRVMMPAYGLAEATVGVSMCEPGRRVGVDERGFVSVGQPFPRIEVGVLVEGRLAGAGETGEIVVRSPANTTGYWNDPEATAELFWGDGFIRTGDLGYVDRQGELFVVGRLKNLIIQGGRNLAPREIEEALDTLPFVRASAAVGVDRGGDEGEQIYAFVELRGRPPESEHPECVVRAVEAVHAHLGLRPGRVYLMPGGAIPRTRNGKVRYPKLREDYLDGSLERSGRLLYPGY